MPLTCWRGRRLLTGNPPALLEEAAQDVATFLGQDIPLTLQPMIEALVGRQQVEDAATGPALGIPGAEDNPRHPGMHQGAGAHGTGFKGDVEGGPGETVVPDTLASITQGADLGMGTGVMGGDGAVPTLTQNLSLPDEDGPHWHLAHGRCPLSQG